MIMKNTRWMRGFWGEAQDVFSDVEQMDEVSCVVPAPAAMFACRTVDACLTHVTHGMVANLAQGECVLGAFRHTCAILSPCLALASSRVVSDRGLNM